MPSSSGPSNGATQVSGDDPSHDTPPVAGHQDEDEPPYAEQPGYQQAYPYVTAWDAGAGWAEIATQNDHSQVNLFRYYTDGRVYYIDGHGDQHQIDAEHLPELRYVDEHGASYFAKQQHHDTVYFKVDAGGGIEWVEYDDIPVYDQDEEYYPPDEDYPPEDEQIYDGILPEGAPDYFDFGDRSYPNPLANDFEQVNYDPDTGMVTYRYEDGDGGYRYVQVVYEESGDYRVSYVDPNDPGAEIIFVVEYENGYYTDYRAAGGLYYDEYGATHDLQPDGGEYDPVLPEDAPPYFALGEDYMFDNPEQQGYNLINVNGNLYEYRHPETGEYISINVLADGSHYVNVQGDEPPGSFDVTFHVQADGSYQPIGGTLYDEWIEQYPQASEYDPAYAEHYEPQFGYEHPYDLYGEPDPPADGQRPDAYVFAGGRATILQNADGSETITWYSEDGYVDGYVEYRATVSYQGGEWVTESEALPIDQITLFGSLPVEGAPVYDPYHPNAPWGEPSETIIQLDRVIAFWDTDEGQIRSEWYRDGSNYREVRYPDGLIISGADADTWEYDVPADWEPPVYDVPPADQPDEIRYFLEGYGDGYPHPEDIYDEPERVEETQYATEYWYANDTISVSGYDGFTAVSWYYPGTDVLQMYVRILPDAVIIDRYPSDYTYEHFDRILDTSGLGAYAYPDPDSTNMEVVDEEIHNYYFSRIYEDGTEKRIFRDGEGVINIFYPDGTLIDSSPGADPTVVVEGTGDYESPLVTEDPPDEVTVGVSAVQTFEADGLLPDDAPDFFGDPRWVNPQTAPRFEATPGGVIYYPDDSPDYLVGAVGRDYRADLDGDGTLDYRIAVTEYADGRIDIVYAPADGPIEATVDIAANPFGSFDDAVINVTEAEIPFVPDGYLPDGAPLYFDDDQMWINPELDPRFGEPVTSGPASDGTMEQVYSADLDGDGTSDYSVRVREFPNGSIQVEYLNANSVVQAVVDIESAPDDSYGGATVHQAAGNPQGLPPDDQGVGDLPGGFPTGEVSIGVSNVQPISDPESESQPEPDDDSSNGGPATEPESAPEADQPEGDTSTRTASIDFAPQSTPPDDNAGTQEPPIEEVPEIIAEEPMPETGPLDIPDDDFASDAPAIDDPLPEDDPDDGTSL